MGNVCIGRGVFWPGPVGSCSPPVFPVPPSEKPKSLCHHCLVGAYLKTPGFEAPGQHGPSALPGHRWGPPGCSCVNRPSESSKPCGLNTTQFKHTHTHTELMLSCLVSWVSTIRLCIRFRAAAKENVFQHQHWHLWFTKPITSIYGSNKRSWKLQCNDYGGETTATFQDELCNRDAPSFCSGQTQ